MNNLKKVISVFDTMLLLVIGLFGTAGLMGFNHSDQESSFSAPVSRETLAELVERSKKLKDELNAREKEAAALEKKPTLDPNITQSLEKLQADLVYAEQTRQVCEKTESAQKDIHSRLNQAAETLQKSYEQRRCLALLKANIEAFNRQYNELKRKKEELEKSIDKADMQHADAHKLQEQIEKIEKEIQSLREQIKKMEEKITEEKPQKSLWWGQYNGPYILLECHEKGVVVYLPDGGSREIETDSTETDRDWLKERIKEIGGAVLVVRPGGFKESYSKFFEILTALALEEKKNDHEINLSFWPIGEDEPISTYMAKGD